MMNNNYIVPAFYFRVLFSGLDGVTEADSNFESVNGIQGITASGNTVASGIGEKNSTLLFQPVVLRRAVTVPQNSVLRSWAINALNNQSPGKLPGMQLEILSEEHVPLITVVLRQLSLHNWSLSELHAQKSNLLTEEISFHYQSIEIN